MKQWIVLVGALVLGGCVASDEQAGVAASEFPSNYREQIVQYAKRAYFDPYSIRDAKISPPKSGSALSGPVTTVCVSANAKNRFGAYTGAHAMGFVFQRGVITTDISGDVGELACAGVAYDPFPELEAGYMPPATGGPDLRSRKPTASR